MALQCRGRLPRCGAPSERRHEGFMRHQELVFLQPEEVADPPVVVARRRRRSHQVAVELLPVDLQAAAHFGN